MSEKYPCANTTCRHNNTVAKPGHYCRDCEKEMERIDRLMEHATDKHSENANRWQRHNGKPK